MEFKQRTLVALADMICGNFKAEESFFIYRSSSYLTEFFQDCGTNHRHAGSTRGVWVSEALRQVLAEPSHGANTPPEPFACIIRTLMDSGDTVNESSVRVGALGLLNTALVAKGSRCSMAPTNNATYAI